MNITFMSVVELLAIVFAAEWIREVVWDADRQ